MNLVKNMDFKLGSIFCFKSQVVTFPINSLLVGFNFITLDKSFEENIDYFSKIFYDDCNIFYNNNFTDSNNKNKKIVILEFLEFLKTVGLLNCDLIKLGDKKLIFTQTETHLSNEFIKLFSSKPNFDFKYFHMFFLKSYLEIIYDLKFDYEISSNNFGNTYVFTKTSEKLNFISDKIYDSFDDSISTPGWIKSLVVNKKINNISGKLIFNDVVSVSLPLFLYFELLDGIFESGNLGDLCNLLSVFGENFSNILKIKGFKEPIDKFEYICAYWNLMGYGVLESCNDEFTSYSLESNFYSFYEKFLDESFLVNLRKMHYVSFLSTFEHSFDVVATLDVSKDLSKVDLIVDEKLNPNFERKKYYKDLIKNKSGKIF